MIIGVVVIGRFDCMCNETAFHVRCRGIIQNADFFSTFKDRKNAEIIKLQLFELPMTIFLFAQGKIHKSISNI